MDFLKDNLFYVILVVAVIVVSVPCYIFGSQQRIKVSRAQEAASSRLNTLSRDVAKVRLVSKDVLNLAAEYRKGYEDQKAKVIEQVRKANEHLDYDYLVPSEKRRGVPPPEQYKQAYYDAYTELQQRIERAGLKTTKNSPLPPMDDWGAGLPPAFHIRVTQKKYWILKALTDVLTDPECNVISVQRIILDNVPNQKGVQNGPDGSRMFWRYPFTIDFIIDFRTFPVFLEKLIANEEVLFEAPGFWRIARAFDETKGVYAPHVSVSLYCLAWDFIAADYEKDWLKEFEEQRKQGGGGGRRGGQ